MLHGAVVNITRRYTEEQSKKYVCYYIWSLQEMYIYLFFYVIEKSMNYWMK